MPSNFPPELWKSFFSDIDNSLSDALWDDCTVCNRNQINPDDGIITTLNVRGLNLLV